MSEIVRQADQYAAFDNTPRPERIANEDPPEDIVHGFTRGRSVGAGQNNPRGIRRQHFAVNTRGMDPESHAYAEEGSFSPYDPGRRRHWDPNTGYQPDEFDEAASEAVSADDESGFNWGPEPIHDDPYGGSAPDTPLQPLDDMLEHVRRPPPRRPPSFNAARRRTADDGPGMDFSGGDFSGGGEFSPLGGGSPIGNDLFTYMFLQKNPHLLSEILGT